MSLQPHQQRVVDEADDLQNKVIKLHDFIGGNQVFLYLDEADRTLLRAQYCAMQAYLGLLVLRIGRFNISA